MSILSEESERKVVVHKVTLSGNKNYPIKYIFAIHYYLIPKKRELYSQLPNLVQYLINRIYPLTAPATTPSMIYF